MADQAKQYKTKTRVWTPDLKMSGMQSNHCRRRPPLTSAAASGLTCGVGEDAPRRQVLNCCRAQSRSPATWWSGRISLLSQSRLSQRKVVARMSRSKSLAFGFLSCSTCLMPSSFLSRKFPDLNARIPFLFQTFSFLFPTTSQIPQSISVSVIVD